MSVAPEELRNAESGKMAKVISSLLVSGLVLSLLIVIVSEIIFLRENAGEITAYKVFTGEPCDLKSIDKIFQAAFNHDHRALMQVGVVVLIATPIARVAFSALTFAYLKDAKFVFISSLVLLALLYSLICAF